MKKTPILVREFGIRIHIWVTPATLTEIQACDPVFVNYEGNIMGIRFLAFPDGTFAVAEKGTIALITNEAEITRLKNSFQTEFAAQWLDSVQVTNFHLHIAEVSEKDDFGTRAINATAAEVLKGRCVGDDGEDAHYSFDEGEKVITKDGILLVAKDRNLFGPAYDKKSAAAFFANCKEEAKAEA